MCQALKLTSWLQFYFLLCCMFGAKDAVFNLAMKESICWNIRESMFYGIKHIVEKDLDIDLLL